MGRMVFLKCPACGYGIRLAQGQGMMDYHDSGREKAKEIVRSGVLGDELKQMLEKYPDLYIYRSTELFHCVECNRYESGSLYKLFESESRFRGKALGTSRHTCRRCKKELVCIEDAHQKKVSCARCQSIMENHFAGCWD